MNELDKSIVAYQRCGRGLEHLLASISSLVYDYPKKVAGYTEDDGAELLLEFYPRIKRLIDRYRPNGSSFEAYLRASLRWQLRSIARSRVASEARRRVACAPGTAEQITGRVATPAGFVESVAESHAGRRSSPARVEPARKRRPANRPSVMRLDPPRTAAGRLTPGEAQRLLFVVLKSSDQLDPASIPRIARIVGCDAKWLADRHRDVLDILERHEARRARFRRQRDRAWFALRYVEDRLKAAPPDDEDRLRAMHARLHERFVNARKALHRSSHAATHEEIATILGVRKGTVDSSVYKARQELRDEGYRARLAALVEHS